MLEGKRAGLFNSRFIATLVSMVCFLGAYYAMMPVLPLYMKGIGGNNFQIGLIMGIFSVVSLALRPISGRLCDRGDPVRLLRISIALFFLSPFCFLSPSFMLVGLAQGIYGFTIGAFTTASGLVVTAAVPEKLMGQAIGIHSIACILAKGMAPALGSALYARGGLNAALLATVVMAAAALMCTWRLKPMPQMTASPRERAPMLRVFAQKPVWGPSLVLLSITITFGAIMTMLPLYAQERGIEHYNLFFTVNTAMVVLVRIASGKREFSANGRILSSLFAICVAVALLAVCRGLPLLLVAAAIYGYGYGLSYPALTGIVMMRTDPAVRGTAFGVYTAFFDVGVALGSAFGGLSEYAGFTVVYGFTAFIPLLGAGLYMLLMLRAGGRTAG